MSHDQAQQFFAELNMEPPAGVYPTLDEDASALAAIRARETVPVELEVRHAIQKAPVEVRKVPAAGYWVPARTYVIQPSESGRASGWTTTP